MTENWQEVSQKTQAERHQKIPAGWRLPQDVISSVTTSANMSVLHIARECGLLSQHELDITENYSATSLLEKLRGKELTSLEVTTAFCKRAAIAQQLVNCCTELLFDSAFQRARECDDYLSREGKPMGPLHGLPISVKDLFHVAGVPTTAGFIKYASEPPQTEAAGITATLLSLGAVLHVKTNMSQLGFAYDSDNNLWGRTLNPLRTGLTPGGSSGGESALIALRGSVLGVGTDSLGSLRAPAHCVGLCTIKPSPDRIPYGGRAFNSSGAPRLPLHVGPLAHSVEDLNLFMRSIIQSEPWNRDASVISVPWRDTTPAKQSLRLGWITEDPALPLHPPMLRAMNSAADLLKKAGHTLIPLRVGEEIPSLHDSVLLSLQFAMMDPHAPGFPAVFAAGEPFVPSVKNCLPPEEIRDQMKPSLDALIGANAQRQRLAEQFRAAYVEDELDAIVMPLHETTAPLIDSWNTAEYIALSNLLPYPSTMVPFSKAEKEKDASFVRSDINLRTPYDPDLVEGMPCSIQVMGKPLRDEDLLRISEELQSCLRDSSHS